MRHRYPFRTVLLALLCSLTMFASSGRTQNPSANSSSDEMQAKGKVVYVCACLKTRSCECMTEAKMEGPCACGTEGGPPMKAVAPDSAWAKENREARRNKRASVLGCGLFCFARRSFLGRSF